MYQLPLFKESKAFIDSLTIKLTPELLLKLYALYQQGSKGDNKAKEPKDNAFKSTKDKYAAWEKLKGITFVDAQLDYIYLARKIKDGNL